MNIGEVISKLNELGELSKPNEYLVIYAKRIDGKFTSSSEAVLLELTEEEMDLKISEIINKYCPGFDYFIEVFVVEDMILDKSCSIEQKIDRVIYYAEFDA